MAAIDSSQPRRKGATYGKASRKRILGYNYNDVFATPQESEGTFRGMDVVVSSKTQQSRGKQTVADTSRATGTQTGMRPKEGSVPRETKSARQHQTVVASARPTGTKESSIHTSLNEGLLQAPATKPSLNVFDVPSSEDDMETPRASLKRGIPNASSHRTSPSSTGGSEAKELSVYDFCDSSDTNERELHSNSSTPRKKRRVVGSGQESPIGLGDGSLQKHIAPQAISGPDTMPKALPPLTKRKKLPKARRSPDAGSTRTGRPKTTPPKPLSCQPSKSLPPEQKLEKSKENRKDEGGASVRKMSPKGAHKTKEISALAALQKMISTDQKVLEQPSSKPRVLIQAKSSAEAKQFHKQVSIPEPAADTEQGLKTPPRVTFATAPRQTRLWNKLVAEGIPTEEAAKHHDVAQMDLSDDGSSTGSESGVRQGAFGSKPRWRIIDSLAKGSNVAIARAEETREDITVAESSSSPAQPSLTHSQSTADVLSQTGSQASATTSVVTSFATVANGPLGGSRVGPKITYAQQRSFLTDNMLEEINMFDAPLPTESSAYPQGGRRYGRGGNVAAKRVQSLDPEQDNLDEANAGPIRSIHELREAGSNKRFLDEMEAFFEDIEDRGSGTLSRKRSALLELGSKLAEKAFARRFVDNNLHQRLFVRLDSEDDIIVGTVLASTIVFTMNDIVATRSPITIHEEGAIQMLLRLLDSDRDIYFIAKERRTNMSKVAQSLVSDFRNLIKASSIWETKDPGEVSPRLIALKGLELLVRRLREEGTTELKLPKDAVGRVVQVLAPFSSWTALAQPTAAQSIPLELALSILESYAINIDPALSESALNANSVEVLASLLSTIVQWNEDDFRQMILLILRLNLSITNNNAGICDAFARLELLSVLVDMVQSKFDLLSEDLDEDIRLYELDGLVLALGLLINFAELSDTARVLLLKSDKNGLLGTLLRIFLDRSAKAAEADSMEESQSNVAFGYLSVLLGTLCQNRCIREFLRLGLTGSTLRPLIDAVDEFLQHHKKVDDQLHDEGGEREAGEGFTQRLQQVVDRLKRSEREV